MSDDETNESCVTLQEAASTKQPNRKARRVLILADSPGKGYSKELGSMLQDKFQVTSIVKPNPKLKEVTSAVRELTQDFTNDDSVIILGGTNNISEIAMESEINGVVENILPLSKNMKVIMSAIPVRYDKPDLNQKIFQANDGMLKTLNSFEDCKRENIAFNFFGERLDRSHFTKHGLHMISKGKNMCKRYCELLVQLHGLVTPPKLNFWQMPLNVKIIFYRSSMTKVYAILILIV